MNTKTFTPIKPYETDTWNKYIKKIYSLFGYYSFTLIHKNNVEHMYKNDTITIKTTFKFRGKWYKERYCNIIILIDDVVIVNDTHYSPKKMYKNLKKNHIPNYFHPILKQNNYGLYSSTLKYEDIYTTYGNDFDYYFDM